MCICSKDNEWKMNYNGRMAFLDQLDLKYLFLNTQSLSLNNLPFEVS